MSRSPYEETKGSNDDAHVEPPARVLHVFQVKANPLLEIEPGLARAAHLPQSGHPGAHAETRLAPGRTELVLITRAGARTDDRHVAEQHVDELRQLVDVRLAYEAP